LVTFYLIRDELTPRRLRMVDKAFAMLDRNGSGHIDLTDISKKNLR